MVRFPGRGAHAAVEHNDESGTMVTLEIDGVTLLAVAITFATMVGTVPCTVPFTLVSNFEHRHRYVTEATPLGRDGPTRPPFRSTAAVFIHPYFVHPQVHLWSLLRSPAGASEPRGPPQAPWQQPGRHCRHCRRGRRHHCDSRRHHCDPAAAAAAAAIIATATTAAAATTTTTNPTTATTRFWMGALSVCGGGPRDYRPVGPWYGYGEQG